MALVDKRVVEMVFKNQDFEAKAQESMKTIDKLKDATKFDDSSSSIDRIAQAVEKLQDRFSTFGVIGKRVLENITDTAMHTAGKITNFLSSGVIGGGVKRAMNLENARFTMMSLYKDADKVAEAMDNVSASVDGTAYSLDQAALIATQFTGAGVEVGEELTNALKGLAGTAATYNADYASLGRVFASVASAGRVYGDDLLQLSTRGMPAAQVLADFFNNVAKGDESIKGVPEDIQNLTKSIAESSDKVADATNVTAGEIKELVSQGKINFDIFSQAMYTTFGENAAKANETFTGAMSNIKSALGRIGAGFVEPLIVQNGPLVNMFNAIRVKINEVKKGLVFDKEANNTEALSKRVTDFVISKIDAITKKFENLDISKFLEAFYNVFDGLISIFKAIGSIITPIKEAFRDIFPKRSADDLVRITSKFKEFTAGIKVSETTIEKIKDIFTGLFGLLDAAKTIAIGFAKSFGPPIIAVLKSVMSWLLSVGSAFGRFFSSVRDVILALKESLKSPTDEITGLPSKIADAFKDNSAFTMVLRILTAFRDGVEKIMNSFRRIRGDGLKDATGEMTEELTIFGSILAGIKKLGESALAVLKTLKDVLSPILGWFADTIKGVVSKTMAVMGELDNDHTMNLIFEGGMGAIFVSIANAIKNIGRGLGGGNGIGAAFASMLGKIGAAFKSVKAYMNAATLKLIADAILELVAAIFLLAIIPEKEAIRGLLIILAIVEILSLIMKKVQAMSTGIESSASYMMIGVAMMALASAILIVTAAIFIIAFMGYDNIVKGLLMISAICLVLTKTMKSITTNLDKASYKSIFGAAAVIASITAAILAITLSIAALTLLVRFLGIGNVAMALGVIVGIALTLGLAIKVMLAAVKNSEMSEFIKMVTTVVIVSAAIVLVATTVTALSIILGILPSSLITKGLLTLTAILLAVVAATLVLLIAFEDQAITDTLKAVSNFLLLAGAIVLISTAMVGIAALIGLIPTEWLVAGLFGMAAIITAIGLFYYALTKMADKMSFKDIAKAVLKFTAVVLVTVGLFGAMLIMAAAIGGVITILGSINIMEVSAFIISLLSVILVGALLSAKVPKFAEGLTGMAKALQTLSTAFLLFAIGARFAEQALIDLKDLTDEDIEHIKKNLSSFADAIAYAAPDIAYAIFSIFTSFVGAFMAFLVESIPLIFDQVVSTIVDSLGSIVNRVPDIVHIIWQVLYGVMEALRPLLGAIVNEVILLAIDLINALAKAIDKNAGPILDAIDRLLDSIIKLVVSAIFRMFGSTQEKTEKFLKKWKTTLRQVGKILIAAFAVAKIAGITKKFGGILTLIKKIGKALSTIKIGSGFTESAKKLTQEVAGDIEKGPLAKIKEFNKYFGGHGVLVTSIAAFAITAAVLFKDFVDDMSVASTEANFLTESIEKQEEAYKKAYNREAAAGRDFEDSLRGQTREIRETDEKTNALLGSLEKYIDKNGKVKESARDTVENGLAYLNETYGTTYSLTDDLRILNGKTEVSFKKLREEIDKTSAAQSATATLDQYKDEYEEAKDWLADAQHAVDLTELQALEEKALESYGESVDDLIKKRKDLGNAITNLDLYDDKGNPLQNWFAEMTTGDFVEAQSDSIQHLRKALELAGTDMAELDKQLSNSKGSLGPQVLLQATIKDAVAYLEEQHTEINNFLGDTKGDLEGLKESYERYSTMVTNYEHLQKAQLSGNADAIREATISLEHNLGDQETMTKESLQRIFEEKQKAAQAEIKLYKNKTAGIRAIEVAGYLEAEYLAWKRAQEAAKTPAEMAKQAAIEAKYLSQIKSLYDAADKAEEEAGWSVSDLIPDDAVEEAEEKASDVGDTVASSTVSSTNLGLKGGQSSIKKATEDSIASPVKDTVSDVLKLGTSASIPFEQGAQTVLDYVNGMNSITTVKTGALSMLSTFLGDMQSSINTAKPSVTPIVDLSALQNGAGVISTMLNGQRVTAANLNGKLSTQIAASINAEQFDVGIDKVIESIRHLNDNVVTLGNRVNKLQVVLDTGAMVGQLAPAMDSALGIRALRKGRGTI